MASKLEDMAGQSRIMRSLAGILDAGETGLSNLKLQGAMAASKGQLAERIMHTSQAQSHAATVTLLPVCAAALTTVACLSVVQAAKPSSGKLTIVQPTSDCCIA